MNERRLITKYDRVELALVAGIAILLVITSVTVISASYSYHDEKIERIATMKCHTQFRTEVPCP